MRVRIGGAVIVLDRKQSLVLVVLVLLLSFGVVHLVSLARSLVSPSTNTERDADFSLQPIPIDRALDERANPRQFQRKYVGDDDASLLGARDKRSVDVDNFRRLGNGNHDDEHRQASLRTSKSASKTKKVVVMAMDGARQRRGSAIKIAQQRLIAGMRRAPDSRYNINVTNSDMTSLDRPLPDTRPPACIATSLYDNETEAADLPSATVIIPFYNEALTMLLRAVHSVLNRSPDRLLDEIIVVDDCSTDAHLQAPLVDYLRLLPKVRLIRNDRRQGLIVSRMRGARLARSPVLFFMDAHAEANVGWLEPLLYELKRNPKQILQPFVDGIDAMSLEFVAPGIYHRGAFSWDLRYTWIKVKDHDQLQTFSTGLPFFSPTLVGCAIAVDKDYFFRIGSFDEGLKVWGGENIELGFRAWMCGGQVTTVTCSRVGHVFKEFPYQFDGNKEDIVQKNLIRVAETWMGGARKYFYASTRIYDFKRAELNEKEELDSLEERKQLRDRLQCRNFYWYLYNVIPEMVVPPMDANFHGEIKSSKSLACWEVTPDYFVTMTYVCYHHKIIPENHFSLSSNGLLRYFDRCVDTQQEPFLSIVECPSTQGAYSRWELKQRGTVFGLLVFHRLTSDGKLEDWCIAQVTNAMPRYHGAQMPQLVPCDEAEEFQMWSFTYGFDWSRVPPEAL